jgi:hypothetical protein
MEGLVMTDEVAVLPAPQVAPAVADASPPGGPETGGDSLEKPAIEPGEPPIPFDESDGWRRTVLYRVTDPGEKAALITLSRLLDRLQLESGEFWDHLGELPAQAEARAAAEDLRYVEAFLALLGNQEYDSYEEPVEYRIGRLARRLAPRVGKLAAALEEAVGR